jgi:hypothetical protein
MHLNIIIFAGLTESRQENLLRQNIRNPNIESGPAAATRPKSQIQNSKQACLQLCGF